MGDLILEQGLSNIEKKVYIKPAINTIKLVADEAVLALCKFNNGVGAVIECNPDLSCRASYRS